MRGSKLRLTAYREALKEYTRERVTLVTTMDIVQVIYRPEHALGQPKDYEFDRPTMEARWAQGLSDAQETIMAAPWLEPMPPELGARTFDVRAKGPIGDTSKNSLNKAGG